LDVDIPRMRHCNRSSIETLINKEALLFAKYLRSEKKDWLPRMGRTQEYSGDKA
jgi:hypothetical protein